MSNNFVNKHWPQSCPSPFKSAGICQSDADDRIPPASVLPVADSLFCTEMKEINVALSAPLSSSAMPFPIHLQAQPTLCQDATCNLSLASARAVLHDDSFVFQIGFSSANSTYGLFYHSPDA